LKNQTTWLTKIILVGALASGIASALAQSYPDRPVRLVVNVVPGGGSDILARKLSPDLSRHLGQNIVVDNKPQASSVLNLSPMQHLTAIP